MSEQIHQEPHPMAGQTVTVAEGDHNDPQGQVVPGASYVIEDWADRVFGGSWTRQDGNIGCAHYGLRFFLGFLPFDNKVLYGKIGSLGHLIHVSEIKELGGGE